jgi:sortase (surface protein transpeptidase)
VPTGWHIAGWYKYGPTPGQVGSSVILGHVDSVGGPAVFYRLNQLKRGSRVIVTLANGQKVTFQVIAMGEYLKTKFPLQLVYGPRSYPSLQLVTCGGTFDSSTGHYLSSIVAFTKEVGA